MSEITPFKGLLFDREKTGGAEKVTAPPYDIIPPGELDKYYDRCDFNIIRLILPKETPDDNEKDNRYLRSAETFKKWIKDGILVEDKAESLYVYRQEYYVEEEKKSLVGIIAALRIEDPENGGSIVPHENTLGKPREDRLRLIRESRANFSPIFGMFEDAEKKIAVEAEEKAEEEPLMEFKDEYEIVHIVRRLTNPEAVREIQHFLRDKKIFIADGHHRYEAASRFRSEMLESNPDSTGKEPYNYIMTYLANMYDEGMTLLPTHRLITGIPEGNKGFIQEEVQEFFTVEELEDYEALSSLMAESFAQDKHCFGVCCGGVYYFLKLKEDSGYERVMDKKFPGLYKELDVCLAHGLIIDHIINRGEEMPQDNLDYEKDPQKAIAMLEDDKFELAIFLNPTKMNQVMDIAAAGLKMPGKATYFYPKPLGGLLLRKL